MPPRPFPLPLGVGTDIIKVSRIRAMLATKPDKQHVQLARFMRRFLTCHEQSNFWRHFDKNGNEMFDVPAALDRTCTHLAGRWAAKEATIKAFTWRKLSPLNIQILEQRKSGGPGPVFALVTERVMASSSDAEEEGHSEMLGHIIPATEQHGDMDGQIAKISISHDGDYATAVCIAAEEPMVGDVGGEARAREAY